MRGKGTHYIWIGKQKWDFFLIFAPNLIGKVCKI